MTAGSRAELALRCVKNGVTDTGSGLDFWAPRYGGWRGKQWLVLDGWLDVSWILSRCATRWAASRQAGHSSIWSRSAQW